MISMDIGENLKDVLRRIQVAYCSVSTIGQRPPRLVAVSKEKPVEYIQKAYAQGQRFFGENKIQDLHQKSHNSLIKTHCPDIQWHFIGRIQSNKIQLLADVHNLHMVETLSSLAHAEKLNSAWLLKSSEPLSVMLQVNTSFEPQKGGIEPSAVAKTYEEILSSCPGLNVVGLMCIGRFGHDSTISDNPDFLELVRCRDRISELVNKPPSELELSMGMSNDFEHAIHLGSTNVRVGTTIFGER